MRLGFLKGHAERELMSYKVFQVDQSENDQAMLVAQDEKFVIQRVLGHREMPGSEKWFVDKECYMCDRWRYTLFMTSHT